MARLDVNGLDGLELDLEELAQLPDEILEEMLLAEADVVERAQKATALAYGVKDTGTMINSIQRTKMSFGPSGVSMEIYPAGSRPNGKKKKTNAEVAFIQEYGKKGQAARPFISEANEQAASAAIEKAEQVYDRYLKSKNL
jgi:HK97 gp10 family phage protein